VTVDEAINDLLSISTDIRRLVVLDPGGAVLGAGPGGAGAEVSAATDGLWRAASERAADAVADAPLDHVVVDLGDAAVVALEAGGRRIVALTEADPPLGLVLFDLRTCLADAFPGKEAPDVAPDTAPGDGTDAAAVKGPS
jgi:predicted regulator of Ras-like GTPase activity (Roadblock/LC7/MglB family)